MLRAENLEVRRGQTQVLTGMSISLRPNAVTALLGGNGSGKSTTLYALSGLAPIQSGKVWLGDTDITGHSARAIVSAGIGHVPQGREVFPTLTVRDNLLAGAAVVTDRRRRLERLAEVLDIFPLLRDKLTKAAGSLSGGEQQQLAIGRALMPGPKVLLMDEPSAGLSPTMVDKLIDTIADLKARNLTILLVEQNVGLAYHAADDAVVLRSGHIVLERKASELFSDRDILSAYLGR
jgi:branched-chain amino acid transport system ATP-binding protein